MSALALLRLFAEGTMFSPATGFPLNVSTYFTNPVGTYVVVFGYGWTSM